MQQLRDQSGPAGLMRGADAAAGVAVKIFVEQHVIAEVRVVLLARVLRRTPAACRRSSLRNMRVRRLAISSRHLRRW